MKSRSISRIAWLLAILLSVNLLLSGCANTKQETTQDTHTCSLTVSCEVLLKKSELLEEEKRELIPEDGILLHNGQTAFTEGESVMDVLKRETMNAKVHLETKDTPGIGSYVEGIGNLYEFDAGELSGWLYCVNGNFTGVAASEYKLSEGDVVMFLYSCDLGVDVGNTAGIS